MKNFYTGFVLLIMSLFFFSNAFSQIPHKYFNEDSLDVNYFNALKNKFGRHKIIPAIFQKPILIALSFYPELKNTPILFRIKRRHTTLQTRSTWAGLFKRIDKRSYVITISDSTEPALTPLLFKNVSFNAETGAAGHELAHVADFSGYSFLHLLKHAISNISPKYLDRFEFKTDSICIAHGLGYQLLAWSKNVRKQMNTVNWRGPDYVHKPQNTERYMNPSTILQRINADSLYLNSQ